MMQMPMENEKMAKQVIDFQKNLFENSFKAVETIQDQTEKLSMDMMEQMPWVTDAGKQAFKDSVEMYKKARDDFKKAVEEGFSRLEEIFSKKEA